MRGLSDKGVLITGGSRGIGRATAKRFLEEGSRVFFCGLEPAEVQQTSRELSGLGRIDGLTCDVSREEEVAWLVREAEQALGEINILINNAGTGREEPFLDIVPAHWDRIIEVNLRGMFLVGQAVARRMVTYGKGGAIVNMSSTNGLVGEDKWAHYNASKGGVTILTKSMAIELGRYGIRVNALCPGYIETPWMTEAMIEERIPLGRLGRHEEVAAAYAFLASDDASFIHGAAVVIDGGQLSF